MKTIDVRLTFASEIEALAVASALTVAALKWSSSSKTGLLLENTAEIIRLCIDHQREVRDAYEAGKPLVPRSALVKQAEKLLPLPGDRA